MSKMKDSFLVPSPKKYVESALRYVGYSRYTTGFLPHALLQYSVQFMNFVCPSIAEKIIIWHVRSVGEKLFKES